jgi:hypothetical protein
MMLLLDSGWDVTPEPQTAEMATTPEDVLAGPAEKHSMRLLC